MSALDLPFIMTRRASRPSSRLAPRLALAVVAVIAAVNLGVVIYTQIKATARPRAETARSFEPREVHDVGLILHRQPDGGDRRLFGLYQLVDHHLADGAEVVVSPALARHLWWLRHTGAVEARLADQPLRLGAEKAAALRPIAAHRVRLETGTAWLVVDETPGEAPRGRSSGQVAEGHILAGVIASDDVVLLPATLYRALMVTGSHVPAGSESQGAPPR